MICKLSNRIVLICRWGFGSIIEWSGLFTAFLKFSLLHFKFYIFITRIRQKWKQLVLMFDVWFILLSCLLCIASCGSCYSFASLAMLESRFRILTNFTLQPVFAPQDVVECSHYSQGNMSPDSICSGFSFLSILVTNRFICPVKLTLSIHKQSWVYL